jgi:hypothetical protein
MAGQCQTDYGCTFERLLLNLLFPLSCLIASVDSFGDLIAVQHQ